MALSKLRETRALPRRGEKTIDRGGALFFVHQLELELIQSHMAQKPVLRDEVGCACVALFCCVFCTPDTRQPAEILEGSGSTEHTNGAAMPTDEGDQDGNFSLTTPGVGATPLPRREPLLLLFRSNPRGLD